MYAYFFTYFNLLYLGIYPVDATKYPRNRLDPRLVEKYEAWRKTGEPLDWEKLGDG